MQEKLWLSFVSPFSQHQKLKREEIMKFDVYATNYTKDILLINQLQKIEHSFDIYNQLNRIEILQILLSQYLNTSPGAILIINKTEKLFQNKGHRFSLDRDHIATFECSYETAVLKELLVMQRNITDYSDDLYLQLDWNGIEKINNQKLPMNALHLNGLHAIRESIDDLNNLINEEMDEYKDSLRLNWDHFLEKVLKINFTMPTSQHSA